MTAHADEIHPAPQCLIFDVPQCTMAQKNHPETDFTANIPLTNVPQGIPALLGSAQSHQDANTPPGQDCDAQGGKCGFKT